MVKKRDRSHVVERSSIRVPKAWVLKRIDPLVDLGVFKSRPDAVEKTILNLLADKEGWPKIDREDSLIVKISQELIERIRRAEEDADKIIRARLYIDLENAWNKRPRS